MRFRIGKFVSRAVTSGLASYPVFYRGLGVCKTIGLVMIYLSSDNGDYMKAERSLKTVYSTGFWRVLRVLCCSLSVLEEVSIVGLLWFL